MTTRTGPTRLAPHPTTRERVSHLTSTTSYGTQPPIDVSAHVVIPAPWQIQMAPDAEQVRWARGDKQVPYTHRMRPPALYAAKARRPTAHTCATPVLTTEGRGAA
jgi:hypothetical protein